jgi:ubiquinone/menaquinone biosynthesis C-methylase UbiE
MQQAWLSKVDSYSAIMEKAYPVNNTVYPYIVKSSQKYNRILDFGCGDGSLGLLFDNKKSITLYDKSSAFIKLAKKKFVEAGKTASFVSDSQQLIAGQYDFISLCFVLMSIKTKTEIRKILQKLFAIKSKNGEILIALTHPCFRQFSYSYFQADFSQNKLFEYQHEGEPFTVSIFDTAAKSALTFTNYHYTLEFTLNTLTGIGFTIVKIKELYDYHPTQGYHKQMPPYLLIHCQ